MWWIVVLTFVAISVGARAAGVQSLFAVCYDPTKAVLGSNVVTDAVPFQSPSRSACQTTCANRQYRPSAYYISATGECRCADYSETLRSNAVLPDTSSIVPGIDTVGNCANTDASFDIVLSTANAATRNLAFSGCFSGHPIGSPNTAYTATQSTTYYLNLMASRVSSITIGLTSPTIGFPRITTYGFDGLPDPVQLATLVPTTCSTPGAWAYYANVPAPAGPSAMRRRRTETRSHKLCPGRQMACVVQDAEGYECIDTDTEIESCGGCPHGEYGSGILNGTNCLTLRGLAPGGQSAGCTAGRCEVYACDQGFRLVEGTCQAI